LEKLLALSGALQSSLTVEDVAVALAGNASGRHGLRARLYLTGSDGSLHSGRGHLPIPLGEAGPDDDRQLHRLESGLTVHLEGKNSATGVLHIEEGESGWNEPAYVSATVNLVSLALQRSTFSERLAAATATAKLEELKTALLSSVSHDFRTPLATISASASSLIDYRDQLDRPTSITLLRGIVEESERLNRYTANLLELTRIEAGQAASQLQALSVSDMLAAAVRRLRPRAGNRIIELSDGNTENIVLADPVLFELALMNVIENSILYSDDDTKIFIAVTDDAGFCEISVADEGWGIPLDQLARIFDRFVQVVRSDTPARGSGLGLAIAKGFVDAMGGSIHAKVPGINGMGTEMRIRLPLAAEASGT
jgi:two-component system sensor histidine kinase KdpD